jgi:RHS repeat-associated protein
VSYTHDGRGWRKSKTVNSATTIYVTDADNLPARSRSYRFSQCVTRPGFASAKAGRELLEYDSSNSQILRRYVYGNGIDEALNQISVTGDRDTLIPDIQGSLIASLASSSGTVTKTAYPSFGETSTTAGSFRYTGRRIDAETNGLYYYRARNYHAAWGRFLQPDPIGLAGGNNLYAYVGNDPLNYVDPSGEFLQSLVGAASSVALG